MIPIRALLVAGLLALPGHAVCDLSVQMRVLETLPEPKGTVLGRVMSPAHLALLQKEESGWSYLTVDGATGAYGRMLRNPGWIGDSFVYFASTDDKTFLGSGSTVTEVPGEHLSQFGPGVLTWSPDRTTYLAFTVHDGTVRWFKNGMQQESTFDGLPMVPLQQSSASTAFVVRNGCMQSVQNAPGDAHTLEWDLIRKVVVAGDHVFVSGLLDGQDAFARDSTVLAKELVTDFAVDVHGTHWVANVTRADAEGPIQRILQDDEIVGELAQPAGPGRVFHAVTADVWAYQLSRWENQVVVHSEFGSIDLPEGVVSYAIAPDGSGEVMANHDPTKSAWTVRVNRTELGDFAGVANQGVHAGANNAYLVVVSEGSSFRGLTQSGEGVRFDEWLPQVVFLPDGRPAYLARIGDAWHVIAGSESTPIEADAVFARETLRVDGDQARVSLLRGRDYMDVAWQ